MYFVMLSKAFTYYKHLFNMNILGFSLVMFTFLDLGVSFDARLAPTYGLALSKPMI